MFISSACGTFSAVTPRPRRSRRRWTRRPRPPQANSRALAFLLSLVLSLGALAAPEAVAQRVGSDDLAVLHDRCVAFVHSNPKDGLERAKGWKEQGGGFYADHCIAMALFELHDYAAAAERFEALATATFSLPAAQRAQTLDQAGEAWLAAHEPTRAKAAFDAAIQLAGNTNPDLLIDRSQALADLGQYWDAIDDLNRAVDLAPDRAEAYIYRGTAYRYVDARELALEDIQRGLRLAPDSTMGLLERGNLRRLSGDIAGARQDWLRVTKLAPLSAEGKAASINLANLKGKGNGDKPPDAAASKTQ